MTGYAWIFLGAFIIALVLLAVVVGAANDLSSENRRLRMAATRRVRHLDREKNRHA